MTKDIDYYMSLNYTVEVKTHSDDSGTYYEACIPQLGAYLVTGSGDTVQEAIESMNAMKEAMFEEWLEHGKEIPKPYDPEEYYSGRILLRTSKDMHKRLVDESKRQGISPNSYLNQMVSSGFTFMQTQWLMEHSPERLEYSHTETKVK